MSQFQNLPTITQTNVFTVAKAVIMVVAFDQFQN